MKLIYFIFYAASLLLPATSSVNENLAALAMKPVTGKPTQEQQTLVSEDAPSEKVKPQVATPEMENNKPAASDEFVSAKYNLPRLLVIE